jgi:hypothetical protein
MSVSNKFKPGDRVRKVGGSYEAEGTVIGDGLTSEGKVIVLFEFDVVKGMVHIFGESQLEHTNAAALRNAYRRGAQPE